KEENMKGKVESISVVLIMVFSLFLSARSYATEWVNPKELFKDPDIARLQRGQKELTDVEKKEIKVYGFTGLEVMTYLYCNQEPGLYGRGYFKHYFIITSTGKIFRHDYLERFKYYYKDKVALVKLDGIKPGDLMRRYIHIQLYPPETERNGVYVCNYLKSEKHTKRGNFYTYNRKIRRVSHNPISKNESGVYGGELTMYDFFYRQLWDSDYRILGEDTIRGHECLVIEGRNKIYKNHYNNKYVSWVDKNIFIDIHEEQFDRDGTLYRVADKEWSQLKPSNWWVCNEWNITNINTKARVVHQFYDWLIDQKYSDNDFEPSKMAEEHLWRKLDTKKLPPLIKKASDLPPENKVRWEFWNKIRVKPVVKNP
ncbi:MAG: outer membrane lipoprotein-sorting protein, partial [Thermodesulfobacteriota bacterium]|nr:outer membrane lipoprotein-sorting protein [Thermodesulfobacteriota bacterium]